mgnify:CR=1 FL=1
MDLSAAAAGGPSAAAATPATLAAMGAMNTLWPLSGDSSRTLVISRVSVITAPLASQQVAVEDAEHVVGLLTTILTDGPALVLSSAYGNATNSTSSGDGNMGNSTQMQGVSQAANALLMAVSDSAAYLTRGLINGAPADGTPVRIATAMLAAAVQRATATLAAAGITIKVAAAATVTSRHRHSRHLIATSDLGYAANAQVSASLNPAVGNLCSSDPTCSSAGLGVAVTIISDPSLLLTSLGGSAAVLAANQSDFMAGSSVQVCVRACVCMCVYVRKAKGCGFLQCVYLRSGV